MNDSYGARSLREVARVLFQHWIMLSLLVAVATAGTWAYCRYVSPRLYRSKVSLMFKRPLNKSPISTDAGERALEVFVKAQQQIVMSDIVLARAMVISGDPALRQAWQKRWRGGLGAEEDRAAVTRFLQKEAVTDAVAELLSSRQDEFEKFRDSVELETPGGEQVAMTETFTLIVDRPGEVGVEGSHMRAMHAADLLSDMYIVRFQALQQELNDPAVRVMDDVIREFERQVREKVESYRQFVNDNAADIGVLEQLLKSGTEHGIQIQLSKVRENFANLNVDLGRDNAVRDALKKSLPEKALVPGGIEEMSNAEVEMAIASVPPEFMQSDITFAELSKIVARLEARLAELGAQYQDESRDVIYTTQELNGGRRNLLSAIVGHLRGLDASVDARIQQIESSRVLIKQIEGQQNAIHKKLVAYAQLKSDFQTARTHQDDLEKQKIDAVSNATRARESVTITKLNAASVPDEQDPLQPKTVLYTIAAFLASFLLSIGFAFFVDHFDHTLRSSIEAERYLGLPVLGSVKKRGRRLVTSI